MTMDKGAERKGRQGAVKPLRVSLAELDQEILRLLARRANLLNKIREKGRVPLEDEKYLREAWQDAVARVSRDPELSGRFFSLMQQLTFLPRPAGKSEESLPGSQRRQAFNLAPPNKPVQANLTAPLSGQQCAAWLYLAAASGQRLRLAPCLQNDPLVDFVQGLAQMGAAITREEDAVNVREGVPLATPDKVIHAGSSPFNLYLFIAHYLGRYSRVKIVGDACLQLSDFSALMQLLPNLGARFVCLVPKSNGLPARLESSGILPAGIRPDAQIPAQFIEALLLAAPFYESPFAVDLSDQPERESILAHILPLLKDSGASFALQESTVSIAPSLLTIPSRPAISMEPELAAFLLALAPALGGDVMLKGTLADWPENAKFWLLCVRNGFRSLADGIEAKYQTAASKFIVGDFTPERPWQAACISALIACAALNGGKAELPPALGALPEVVDFLRMAGLAVSGEGQIKVEERQEGLVWNAPSPAWALALAVAACRRKGKAGWQLGNPGIITELWPHFWAFYNSLPAPRIHKKEEAKPAEKPRRRIITDVVAVPPEIREEDWG